MEDDTLMDGDKQSIVDAQSRELWLALKDAGIKPLVRQEIIDNKQFAKIAAGLINGSFDYLMPAEATEHVELLAATPVTLQSHISYLDLPYGVSVSLMNRGVYTVGDLILRRPSELLKFEQVGKIRVQQIGKTLASAGFELRGQDEPYWDVIKRIHKTIADAPVEALFDGDVVIDNRRNRTILNDVESIGELSTWTRRMLYTISGDPKQSGKQLLEGFLREHGLREMGDE